MNSNGEARVTACEYIINCVSSLRNVITSELMHKRYEGFRGDFPPKNVIN